MQDTGASKRQEIRALTGLRGVAALWVMLFHALWVRDPANPLRVLIDNGYLAVDLFFVLSGYVMALNYGALFGRRIGGSDCLAFLGKRLARTYPLYASATLVALLCSRSFSVPLEPMPGQVCGMAALVPNMLLAQSWHSRFCSIDAPGWSISAEWGAYLLFPLLCQAVLFGTRSRACLAVLASIAALVFLSFVPKPWLDQFGGGWGLNISNGQTFAPGLRCVAGFTLGLATYRLARSSLGVALSTRGSTSLVFLTGLILLLCMHRMDLLAVGTFPLLVASLTQDRGLAAKALGLGPVYFLGEISYSLYLVHFLIFSTIEHMTRLPGEIPAYAVMGIAVMCTLLAATLTYYLIERPGRRLLNATFSRRSSRAVAIQPRGVVR